MSIAFAGTAPLLKATLRHDGRSFATWVAIATALSASSVLVYPWIFPNEADRQGLSTAINANFAHGLILGPAFDISTTDGFNTWRSLALAGFLTAIGAIFAVVKAARGKEGSGQAELLASGVLSGGSRLLTALGLACIGSLLVGIIASIFGVQTMLKLRSEEFEDRVEPILAGAISRSKLFLSYVLVAFVFPAIYVLLAGVFIAMLAAGADIGVDRGDTILQACATVPAVWTVIAVSVAVVGARPGVAIAAWAGVLMSFVLTLLGPTFKLWDWVLAISPFWHVPNFTDHDATWSGLLWISLVTLVLLFAGFAGFRRRDIASE